MDLSLETRHEDGHTIIEVGGEIDVYTAPKLRDKITELVGNGELPPRDRHGEGRLPRLDRSRRAGRRPEEGARPRRLDAARSATRSGCSRSSGSPAWRRCSPSTGRRPTRSPSGRAVPSGPARTATGITRLDRPRPRARPHGAAGRGRGRPSHDRRRGRSSRRSGSPSARRARCWSARTATAGRDAAGPSRCSMRLEDRLRVRCAPPAPSPAQDPPTSDIDGVEPWALLRGLIDDFEIATDGRQHHALDVLAARRLRASGSRCAGDCATSHSPAPADARAVT